MDDLGEKYCINLASRPDRWKSVSAEFSRVGVLGVKRFEAVPCVPHGSGFVGCRESHLGVLSLCKDVKRFTVFEDDVCFMRSDFLGQVSKAISEAPLDWDMLYLGANPLVPMARYSESLFRLKKGYCTHAMVFNNHRVVDFILSNRSSIRKIDVFYADVVQEKFNVFITYPLLATQADGRSDVTRMKNNYHDLIINNYNAQCR